MLSGRRRGSLCRRTPLREKRRARLSTTELHPPDRALGRPPVRPVPGGRPRGIRVAMTGPVPGARGGIAACAELLAKRLPGDARVGSVDYIGIAPGLKTQRMRKVALAVTGWARFLWTVLARPDAAYIHTSRGGDFWRNAPLMWAAALLRVPIVLHVHPADAFAAFLHRGCKSLRRVRLCTTNIARIVIAPSEVGCKALQDAGVRSPVTCIPNPVDTSRYKSAPLSQRRCEILYLGWLTPEKGADDLLRIVPALQTAFPDIRVYMYGPYGAERIARGAAQLGVGRVVVTGEWIDGPDKSELLSRVRALVLPSYSEGLPVVLLEALASGTPCVATHVGGIPEVVQDGETGYLARPGAHDELLGAVRRLLTDNAKWEEMSKTALLSVGRYDATVVTAQVADALEAALGK